MSPANVCASKPLVRRTDWRSWFVWGLWLALSLITLVMVVRCRSPWPFWDEWLYIPLITGQESLSLERLWKPHSEDHLPLTQLIFVGLGRLAHGDFRVVAIVNALVLIGLTAGLILAVRRLRGQTLLSDAVLPLTLLHLCHFEHFRIAFMNRMMSSVLSLVLLLVVLRVPPRWSWRELLLAGVCLFSLPLSGTSGVPVALALSLWLGGLGFCAWRRADNEQRASGAILMVLSLLCLALMAFCLHDCQRQPWHPPPPNGRAWLNTGLQCLVMGFMPWAGTISVVIAFAFVLGSIGYLGWSAWHQPDERPRIIGLLLFLGASAGMAIPIGWGRGGLGPDAGRALRYALIMAPVSLTAYLTWSFLARNRWQSLVAGSLFLLALVCLPFRMIEGWHYAEAVRRHAEDLERDARAGTPIDDLVEYHSPYLFPDPPRLARDYRSLRQAFPETYCLLREDPPPVTEVKLRVTPSFVNELEGQTPVWQATGRDPYVVYTLPEPRYVSGIRFRYRLQRYSNESSMFQFFWARDHLEPFEALERNRISTTPSSGGWLTRVVWVHDRIQRFRIDPDIHPCEFEIADLTLLEPVGATGP